MLTVRTAEHGGRLRKYYHITAEGRKRIEDFKDDWNEILSIYRFGMKEDTGNAETGISCAAAPFTVWL